MSYNGSGLFNINSSGQPVVASTLITAATHNALTADLATGLSTAITKDGQTTPTANIPLGGFKLTGVGAATARTDAASLASLQDGTGTYVATVGGTVDVITLTAAPAITAYAAGQTFRFIAAGANTTTVTVNVSGLGAKALTKNGTTVLAAADIASGTIVEMTYDGTRFVTNSVVASTVVSSFTAGTTGFTPSTSTTGAVTLAGTLAIANGGTGASTLTANYALLGNGTSALQMIAPGTSGNVLTSNGSTWESTTPTVAGDMVLASVQTVTGAKTFGGAGAVGKLKIAGTTSGATILDATAAAGSGTVTLPTTGTLATLAGTETLTNKTVTAPVLSGSVTGTYTLAGTPTITSPTITGASISTMASSVITSGTAVATTSGTSIDFTSIPSWVKRVTISFNENSTNGSSNRLIQIGAGSVTTTGYISSGSYGGGTTSSTAGFIVFIDAAAYALSGQMVLTLLGSNTWISSHAGKTATNQGAFGGGSIALGGTLDRVRFTTVNGTDTFDAGSVNILYE